MKLNHDIPLVSSLNNRGDSFFALIMTSLGSGVLYDRSFSVALTSPASVTLGSSVVFTDVVVVTATVVDDGIVVVSSIPALSIFKLFFSYQNLSIVLYG